MPDRNGVELKPGDAVSYWFDDELGVGATVLRTEHDGYLIQFDPADPTQPKSPAIEYAEGAAKDLLAQFDAAFDRGRPLKASGQQLERRAKP